MLAPSTQGYIYIQYQDILDEYEVGIKWINLISYNSKMEVPTEPFVPT